MNDFVPHSEAQSLRHYYLPLGSAQSLHIESTNQPRYVCDSPALFQLTLAPNKIDPMCYAIKAKSHPYHKILLLYPGEVLQNPQSSKLLARQLVLSPIVAICTAQHCPGH